MSILQSLDQLDKLERERIGESDKKNWHDNYDAKFEDLVGKTIVQITGKVGDDTMRFVCNDGEKYTTFQLHYYSDCCADARVEDICGDLNDLLQTPILKAEEVSNTDENPPGVKVPEYQDSFTWTFYHLSTIKGTVTIRWYGSSNGYYSERATFERLP